MGSWVAVVVLALATIAAPGGAAADEPLPSATMPERTAAPEAPIATPSAADVAPATRTAPPSPRPTRAPAPPQRRKRATATPKRAASPAPRATASPAVFGFTDIARKARKIAAQPYRPPNVRIPEWLANVTYDQWREIRFLPEFALWRDEGLPFQAQFFHPGLYYDRVVTVNVVDAKGPRPLMFSPTQFDYGRNDFASRVPQDLGYAGFRFHAPIKRENYYDEVLVFLGATYFRGVGRDEVFGLSARALAIDTALPSGEEFPYFTEFWLVRPDPPATSATVYALLDSPSVAGAYQFVVTPGEQTTVLVTARLHLRREVQKIGIAPLTSMFFHGENTTRPVEDFRPEVHDSDGLAINLGSGEWVWRPLDNPPSLEVRRYPMPAVRGFGLIQRDRDFDHYQDLETHQEQRPSAWVTPHGDWGSGAIELVEIPTKSDYNDNVVAYWVPDRQPRAGEAFDFGYTLAWYGEDATRPPTGRVIATRRDRGTGENQHRFVVDFAGGLLDTIPADQVVRGDVSVAAEDDAVELLDQQVVKNPATGGWRLTFQVRPRRNVPVELRALLAKGGETLTETWSYLLLP